MAPKSNQLRKLQRLYNRAGCLILIQLVAVSATGAVCIRWKFNQQTNVALVVALVSFLLSIIISLQLRISIKNAKQKLEETEKPGEHGFAPLAIFAFTNLSAVQITSFIVGLIGLGAGTTFYIFPLQILNI